MDAKDASAIGTRARKIRSRRGLSLDVVAGLAGISKSYLGMLEHGLRGFNQRGLLEDLAGAQSDHGRWTLFVLVGVAGFEPTASSSRTLIAVRGLPRMCVACC